MKCVRVLCTGNSCRSIMAEALINALAEGRYQAVSAGSNPTGEIHEKSFQTLRRHGLSVDGFYSKSWDVFEGQHFDKVITVCDSAAAETCPLFKGNYSKLHWSIPDPAKATGDDEAICTAFNDAFYLIKQRIQAELL